MIEWLQQIGLDEYYEVLDEQQYRTMEDMMEISWEDLEEIGIRKLGMTELPKILCEEFGT